MNNVVIVSDDSKRTQPYNYKYMNVSFCSPPSSAYRSMLRVDVL